MIKFSYVICYVNDIQKALKFYEEAFGISSKFVHESSAYVELDTGAVTLAFASDDLGAMNLPEGYTRNDPSQPPSGCEVVFTADDVPAAFEKAISVGGVAVVTPVEKPWNQLVAYVRDPNGVLIEIASPMA